MTAETTTAETTETTTAETAETTTAETRIPAVFVSTATCHGSGTDRFRWVSGLTKKILAQIPGEYSVLVPSHTTYLGQKYKLAIINSYGAHHRQIYYVFSLSKLVYQRPVFLEKIYQVNFKLSRT